MKRSDPETFYAAYNAHHILAAAASPPRLTEEVREKTRARLLGCTRGPLEKYGSTAVDPAARPRDQAGLGHEGRSVIRDEWSS